MSRQIIPGWTRTLAQWQQIANAQASTDEAFSADMTRMYAALDEIATRHGQGARPAPASPSPIQGTLEQLWTAFFAGISAESRRNWRMADVESLLAAWRDESVRAAA